MRKISGIIRIRGACFRVVTGYAYEPLPKGASRRNSSEVIYSTRYQQGVFRLEWKTLSSRGCNGDYKSLARTKHQLMGSAKTRSITRFVSVHPMQDTEVYSALSGVEISSTHTKEGTRIGRISRGPINYYSNNPE
jgi:hypothetical protein